MFGCVRRIGETVDAVAAFLGAAVAGVALFLPIAFSWTSESAPYRVGSLINSTPRGAAIGVIVAVAVAVLITTFTRPAAGWLTAAGGALGMLINHSVGQNVSSADTLTTQNYLDAVCGGVMLGALGAVALGRPASAFGFALGGAGFFVFGDLSEVLEISNRDPYSVLETPPRWLIAAALLMLLLSTSRHRAQRRNPGETRMAWDLPIAPILAAMVLALVILAVAEWLNRQFQNTPEAGHAVDIGLAIAATVLAATVAAMLLPGRDGVGVYLAVSLVAVADAVGGAPRPGWSAPALLVLTAAGLFLGRKLPAVTVAVLLIAGLGVFAVLVPDVPEGTILFIVGSAGIALTVGYCCGVVRPRYAPSGVLALSALYLPSVITALPTESAYWPGQAAEHHGTRLGRTALAITIGCTVGLVVLHRIRPRLRPRPTAPIDNESFADT